MCHIFLETLGKLQLIGDDCRYHNLLQDNQEAQEHPPSTRMFLMERIEYGNGILAIFITQKVPNHTKYWLKLKTDSVVCKKWPLMGGLFS